MRAPGDAESRVLRIIYLSLGLGGIVYLAVGFSKATGEFASLEPHWAVVSYAAAAAGPILLAATATWVSHRGLRRLAAGYAIIFLVVMLAFPLTQEAPLPDSGSPWTNDLLTIPAIAVAIGARRRTAWAYVIVSGVLSGAIRYATAPEQGIAIAALDLLYNTFFNTVFVALTMVSRSSARRLDEAATAAQAKTSREAEASARVQQRIRIDALVHDHVLSALLIASRAESTTTPALRELAASTLRTLRDDVLPGAEMLHGEDFVSRLRSSVTSQSSGIEFERHLADEARIPADIAQALLEATAEAVRNSLRHADPPGRVASRQVIVRSTGSPTSGVEIAVVDDGRGFNSRRIPPERLGVRVSILNRMATLSGGYADIQSTRGDGTRVLLGWRPEAHS